MKMMTGVLVVAVMMLTACGTLPGEQQAQESQAEASTPSLQTQEAALARDCTVTIECADGTPRTCSGTAGACAASGAGSGSVTCNGVTTGCAPILEPVCSCQSDRCCNPRCLNDPDCRLVPQDPTFP
ncbi:hypothetical protein OV207_00620 [Corallococcus sp. BB11-1]|uniref:hypothetical protein n=1 Tax=Corallococcus sp. BB11-1 TaxID=2996783 RepID=UPI0022720F56|nr:hypothetical protein [Corallococcus sp. BB11-1]MCY1029946.1 hypothetical protein [Corallococcus sp. BB11-1]